MYIYNFSMKSISFVIIILYYMYKFTDFIEIVELLAAVDQVDCFSDFSRKRSYDFLTHVRVFDLIIIFIY